MTFDKDDLINIPEEYTVWLNIYPGGEAMYHAAREIADEYSTGDRIACIPVTFKEGEGL